MSQDVRESPALEVIRELRHYKADVGYIDPFVPNLTLYDGTSLQSQSFTSSILRAADLIIVTTAHSSFDYTKLIDGNVRGKVLDTRNALAKFG